MYFVLELSMSKTIHLNKHTYVEKQVNFLPLCANMSVLKWILWCCEINLNHFLAAWPLSRMCALQLQVLLCTYVRTMILLFAHKGSLIYASRPLLRLTMNIDNHYKRFFFLIRNHNKRISCVQCTIGGYILYDDISLSYFFMFSLKL